MAVLLQVEELAGEAVVALHLAEAEFDVRVQVQRHLQQVVEVRRPLAHLQSYFHARVGQQDPQIL